MNKYIKEISTINWITPALWDMTRSLKSPNKTKNELSYTQNIDIKMNCQSHSPLWLRKDIRCQAVQNTQCTDEENLGQKEMSVKSFITDTFSIGFSFQSRWQDLLGVTMLSSKRKANEPTKEFIFWIWRLQKGKTKPGQGILRNKMLPWLDIRSNTANMI